MKTPQLGTALVPVPITGSSVTVTPPIGLTATDLQAIIDEIQAEIDGLLPGALVVQESDGSPSVSASTLNVPDGTLDVVGVAATVNYVGSRNRREILRTVAAAGATVTLDWSLYNSFDITLTAACVISFSNVPASGADAHINVVLRQGGTGSYTVTWPAAVKWQSATGTNTGSAPTLWTAVGAQDDFELSSSDGGTTVGGSMTPHPAAVYTLTVDDEGTPLSTGATTLDFVGAGVTASGSGTTKTITVSGAATSITEALIYGVGGHWEVLMDPATSSPPVPLTTPDGADWVYGWLSDGG